MTEARRASGVVADRLPDGGTRALTVLELLGRREQPVATGEIAVACGIPRGSTHRLLNRMQERGFVDYDVGLHAWGLGVAVVELGSAYLRRRPLHRLGSALLLELTERLEATSHLAILDGADVVYIGKEQPVSAAPTLVTELGTRLPAHQTAVGRAMLAWLAADDVCDRCAVGAAAADPDAVERLLAELAEVRERGYATDDGMITPGISCVAAGVLSGGRPVAAIGVTFVSAQHGRSGREQIAAAVRDAGARLSAAVGPMRLDGAPPSAPEEA